MEFNLYAIKDELSAYTMPMAMEKDELAKRHFRNQLAGNEIMKNSKKDFSIYRIWNIDYWPLQKQTEKRSNRKIETRNERN